MHTPPVHRALWGQPLGACVCALCARTCTQLHAVHKQLWSLGLLVLLRCPEPSPSILHQRMEGPWPQEGQTLQMPGIEAAGV